ncbi:hypothetical protein OAL15_01195 [Flavobacteriales bacterium]|nr:hypothetical protein [Flavobacteriales bacterium]
MRTLFLITLSSLLFVSCQEQESEIGRYQFGGGENLVVIDTKTGVFYAMDHDYDDWLVWDVVNREYSNITLMEVEELTSIKNILQK